MISIAEVTEDRSSSVFLPVRGVPSATNRAVHRPAAMSTFPYLARTTLKYKSPHATDLSFAKDETIRVTGPSDDDEDWLLGETMDGSKSGGFPKDFIVPIEGEAASEPASTETTAAAPSQAAAVVQDDPPPMSKEAAAPPSPKITPASLPPSTTASPAPSIPAAAAPAPSAPTGDDDEPAKRSMKDRLAFFAAAQTKAGPPPPIKPKPAAGGLTWSQRQKLRQEQEAKEREEGGGTPAAAPAGPAVTPAAASAAPAPAAPAASGTEGEVKAGAGLSAADAQNSIGKGGSLKERMAALRGAGAFGAPEAKAAPSPPPKASGKVWSRPAAPEPQPGDEEEDEGAARPSEDQKGEAETGTGDTEVVGEEATEETEEEQEKARRAAIAARMAKLGARGPMGMAAQPPPKPARKPTSDNIASSPTAEKSDPVPTPFEGQASVPSSPVAEKKEQEVAPGSAISPPVSVAMPAIPRRTAGPRRAARPAAAKPDPADDENRLEKVHPDGTISPPPAVMVANEEEPMPKSEQHIERERQEEKAGKGPEGMQGAQAAGIALAPVSGNVDAQDAEESEEGAGEGIAPVSQAPEMIPINPPAPSPSVNDVEPPHSPRPAMSPSHAIPGLPKDEIEMKHEHDAQMAEQKEEEDEEEKEAPPQPPQRVAMDRPTGPRPLPSAPAGEAPPPRSLPPRPTQASVAPPQDETEDEEEREADEEDDVPAPPPRQPSMPLPPRPVPVPAESDEDEEGDEAPPPPPPVRRTTLPPPPAQEEEEEEQEEEEEGEGIPPPPPRREPSVPVPIQMPPRGMSSGPKSPILSSAESPIVASSPTRSNALDEDGPTTAEPETTGEDEEAARRQGIAARMAKLGGIKFGVPPPVPKVKRTMTSDNAEPSSPGVNAPRPDIPMGGTESGPTSPIRSTRKAVPQMEASQPEKSGEGDETPEQESERRRKTLARLRAGGTLGYGMFGQGHGGAQATGDERGVEEEEAPVEEEPETPAAVQDAEPVSPVTARPPVPAGRPLPSAPTPSAQEDDEEDGAPPPPPAGRPPVPSNRPMPPTPGLEEDDDELPPPPPPPARPMRTATSDVPQSPVRSTSTRTLDASTPGPPSLSQPVLGGMSTMAEPSEMAPRSPDTPTRPPPIQTNPSQTSLAGQQGPESPIARRSMSIASRQSFQSTRSPSSPAVARQDSMRSTPEQGGRSSFAGNRPGFNELQAASQDAGARVLRAAQGLFGQGKRGYMGDGSPAGFVMVVYEQAKLPRPEQSWGQVVFEQEGGSVMKKYDEPRAGDIAAFYDAKLKGKKGLSSYNQHVGSVEDPLVGVIAESEQKKHKLRVMQVERGVSEEVSYRCDDLKSGRIVVFRPGM
ncbi:uncharacterized protein MKK02DRAFT_37826 [Dioszegia hungarica]|uniref:SH3 domain-containing protein n=1 Tax=Dioszegia hungarica TaxID=4972 RepID=A0AA38LTM6_9TREE|nr:uncharacterized protein MKK02DRAFT_37826 [Dioszegia hungarica]KAI9634950.1 hypothetical protein MKK02DRAFT_37826 [Dioszegia hungarica]